MILPLLDLLGPFAVFVAWAVAAFLDGEAGLVLAGAGAVLQVIWIVVSIAVERRYYRPPTLSLGDLRTKLVLSVVLLSAFVIGKTALLVLVFEKAWSVFALVIGPPFLVLALAVRAFALRSHQACLSRHPDMRDMLWIHNGYSWKDEEVRRDLRVILESLSIAAGDRLHLPRSHFLSRLPRLNLGASAFLLDRYVVGEEPARTLRSLRALKPAGVYLSDERKFVTRDGEEYLDGEEIIDVFLESMVADEPFPDLCGLYLLYLRDVRHKPRGGTFSIEEAV